MSYNAFYGMGMARPQGLRAHAQYRVGKEFCMRMLCREHICMRMLCQGAYLHAHAVQGAYLHAHAVQGACMRREHACACCAGSRGNEARVHTLQPLSTQTGAHHTT